MNESATRVLLIEDDPRDSRLVREMLGAAPGASFVVEHEESLAPGLERLVRGAVDVILLDLGLPDSDGLETFDSVHQAMPAVPIVVLSHVDDEAPAMEAARRGAQDYLVKGRMDAYALARAVRYAIERARAEAALRESQQASKLLATAVEQGAEAIYITDLDGTIQYVNPSFERITGYSREDVVGHNPRILNSGRQDGAFYREMWEALARGDVWSGHLINRRKDGTLYRQDATISPVRDASGAIVSYVCAARDVTRERELEDQLRQSQKMEAVGQLAGGVAHDFNNLLTAIMGNSELLLARMDDDDARRADLDEIRKAGARAASLTRQLLAFSRRQVLEPVFLDLNSVVESVAKMIERVIGEHVELVTVLYPDLGQIHADPGQIEHVIINLAVNARDAMPEGGKLLIETTNADLDEEYVSAHTPVQPGPYVMLAISDTGSGMDEATRARVFEPFFTTKESGKGTGLGLSTVYGIVKQSNGYIWVYSEPGQGTTFKIYLPRVEDVEAVVRPKARGAAERRRLERDGKETGLVVEDDDAVRAVVRRALEGCGYTVVEARDAAEATRLAGEYAGAIDFLITDLIMPETSGRDLARRVAEVRPDVRVLYMSGYSDNVVLRQGMLSPGMQFLAKPFTQESLLDKVREILDTPAADCD
ncbi:MAG: response regulator [Gemmatimonadota bacterium]|nr:MAG: response regulator [Gemmatimonadota bacterium]